MKIYLIRGQGDGEEVNTVTVGHGDGQKKKNMAAKKLKIKKL